MLTPAPHFSSFMHHSKHASAVLDDLYRTLSADSPEKIRISVGNSTDALAMSPAHHWHVLDNADARPPEPAPSFFPTGARRARANNLTV
jgi:hypothetical protein